MRTIKVGRVLKGHGGEVREAGRLGFKATGGARGRRGQLLPLDHGRRTEDGIDNCVASLLQNRVLA